MDARVTTTVRLDSLVQQVSLSLWALSRCLLCRILLSMLLSFQLNYSMPLGRRPLLFLCCVWWGTVLRLVENRTFDQALLQAHQISGSGIQQAGATLSTKPGLTWEECGLFCQADNF